MSKKKTILMLAAATLAISLVTAEQTEASNYRRGSRRIQRRTKPSTPEQNAGSSQNANSGQNSSAGQNAGSGQNANSGQSSHDDFDNRIRNSGSVELQPSGSIQRAEELQAQRRQDPRQFNPYASPEYPYRHPSNPYVTPDQYTDSLTGITSQVREQIRPLAHQLDATYYEAIGYYIKSVEPRWADLDPRFETALAASQSYRQQIDQILSDNGALEQNRQTWPR